MYSSPKRETKLIVKQLIIVNFVKRTPIQPNRVVSGSAITVKGLGMIKLFVHPSRKFKRKIKATTPAKSEEDDYMMVKSLDVLLYLVLGITALLIMFHFL